jgi:CobQ-like glutamine amidotransferase family enzyme
MSHSTPLQIVHLYPREMNIYGDTGNRMVIEKRLKWRHIPYKVHLVSTGDEIPRNADIIIGGGGQDASQGAVAQDLGAKRDLLAELAGDGCVMLMVCGMYQLFGKSFTTSEGHVIKGIGILPIETVAKPGRLIGNVHVDMDGVGSVIGYENHSGRTYLQKGAQPLARVVVGSGNNDDSGYEGCRKLNVFGTYMHGPVLSKNPILADYMIKIALERKGFVQELTDLDDTLILTAHSIASKRPR